MLKFHFQVDRVCVLRLGGTVVARLRLIWPRNIFVELCARSCWRALNDAVLEARWQHVALLDNLQVQVA